MDLLDLSNLASTSALPLSVARYYRDRFILFVPSVRIGRSILHPPEAVGVMRVIADHAAAGLNAQAIQAALEEAYPVTAISSTEIGVEGIQTSEARLGRALAAAVAERGDRFESELRQLREQIARGIPVERLQSLLSETRLVTQAAAEENAAELARLRSIVESLGEQLAHLASREQLEWIGDVVAAAALRPPQDALDAALERRLTEIQDELRARSARLAQEVEALPARFGEQTDRSEKALHQVFASFIAALRQEIASLRSGLTDVQRAIAAATVDYLPFDEPRSTPYVNGNGNGHDGARMPEQTVDPVQSAHAPARPPRRLGQPLRANGAAPGDADPLQHGE